MINKHFKGIYIRNQSIRIDFMYKSIRYRYTLNISPNKENIKYAAQLRSAALNALKINKFNEKDFFPHSKRKSVNIYSSDSILFLSSHYLSIKEIDITIETQLRYEAALKVSVNIIGTQKKICEIMLNDIQNLRVKLTKNFSITTSNYYISVFKGFLKWCEDNSFCKDLSKHCKLFSTSNKDPDPLSTQEFYKIINTGCLNDLDRAIIALAVYTGLRPGEICGLACEDIDLEKNILLVRRAVTQSRTFKIPKTGKERIIYLLPPAKNALKTLLNNSKNNPSKKIQVWLNRHQFREEEIKILFSPLQFSTNHLCHFIYSPNSWNKKWETIIHRANIRHRPPYQTRHTYACWNLTARGNLAFIANQLGHVDYSMLIKVYARWMESESYKEIEFIWKNMQKKNCPFFGT